MGRRIIPARMAGCWLGDDSLDAVHLASDEKRRGKKKREKEKKNGIRCSLDRLWIVARFKAPSQVYVVIKGATLRNSRER